MASNSFVIPKSGVAGVNVRSQPVKADTTAVGVLSSGKRLELEEDGAEWRQGRVYVSTQLAEAVGDQFVQLKLGAVMSNIRQAPVLVDATRVGQLQPGQQLELIQLAGDWLLARVFLSAEVTDVGAGEVIAGAGRDPGDPGTAGGDGQALGPTGTFISAAEALALPLAPAHGRMISLASSPTAQRTATIWNKYGGMLEPLAARVGITPNIAVAVMKVESNGSPFGPDGRMTIRFETGIFWGQWGQFHTDAFDQQFTRVPQQYRVDPGMPFQTTHTGLQASEWNAFGVAQGLDDTAAKRSISMGLGQIMGFNHKRVGYATVDAMFDAYSADERWQVLGLFSFIAADGAMVQALQRGDFLSFARGYNGDSPQAATYATLIEGALDAFNSLSG